MVSESLLYGAGGLEEAYEGEYRQITLRFPREMAYRVYDEFDKTQVRQQGDGSLVACARMPEDAWLTGYLLSFGTQVEILSPASLKGKGSCGTRNSNVPYKPREDLQTL